MFKKLKLLLIPLFLLLNFYASAQVNEDKTGAWYMYFWNTQFEGTNWGILGDVQYRNWNLGGDLQQLILRGGLSYSIPKSNFRFALAYGHFISGAYGESDATFIENRIHQDALFSHDFNSRFFFTHRLRYEQRWVENQDFRTRYRYSLFLNIPLNQQNLGKNAIYLALNNEVFLNGQQDIGNGQTVETFDRNWFYSGLGYSVLDNLRVQLGYMHESSNAFNKGQLQLSLFHSF
jgi:hypothetical protein